MKRFFCLYEEAIICLSSRFSKLTETKSINNNASRFFVLWILRPSLPLRNPNSQILDGRIAPPHRNQWRECYPPLSNRAWSLPSSRSLRVRPPTPPDNSSRFTTFTVTLFSPVLLQKFETLHDQWLNLQLENTWVLEFVFGSWNCCQWIVIYIVSFFFAVIYYAGKLILCVVV